MTENEPHETDNTPYAVPGGRLTPGFDGARIEAAVRELLIGIGEDPDRDGLRDTPARVARAYAEVFSGIGRDPGEVLARTFDISHEEMILVRDIEVYSTCEHHLMPFHGVAHVCYIPPRDGRVTGLSKIARLVEIYARRPQVQERLTGQIADALMGSLHARGALVVINCEHLCMTMRGVHKPGARTLTSAVRGLLRDPATRAEAMSLINA
ncbi:MAG: GTP cyclohydrolase I FolE [Propionibacteriaceae bacterium]|nr:GTP cyclohydrolase I FolE [Propionibacteriaceae bacterium]